ncbi:MAG TPA: hypothetical protein VJU14_02560 [Solirubrobacterales bacterium]|nr:hypothetical protein [Solirubrobacterales bacterium]
MTTFRDQFEAPVHRLYGGDDDADTLLSFAPDEIHYRPRLLSLAEAAEQVPLSEKQLRRVATRKPEPGRVASPFLKVEGRWMVYEDELHAWVKRRAEEDAETAASAPAPRRRRRPTKTAGTLAAVLAEEDAA